MTFRASLLALLIVASTQPELHAQERPPGEITLSGGAFAIFNRNDLEAELGLRYRLTSYEMGEWTSPVVGVTATSENDVYYYGGFQAFFPMSERWAFSPGVGGGIYDEGDGRDLGGPFAFWVGGELSYRLTDHSRVGIYLYHLSNWSLYDDNPGSESLVLTYTFDLSGWFAPRTP